MFTKNEFLQALIPELVSTALEPEVLATCPCYAIPGTEFVIVARYRTISGNTQRVTNEMAGDFYISAGAITTAAIKSMAKEKPIIKSMSDVIDYSDGYTDHGIFLLTNTNGEYGASEIICPSVQIEASRIIGGDYYIAPSSKHEVFLISVNDLPAEAVENTVKYINAFIPRDAVLTDTVYKYDMHKKAVIPALDGQNEARINIEMLGYFESLYKAYMEMNHSVQDPMEEIKKAIDDLQDGEILQILIPNREEDII